MTEQEIRMSFVQTAEKYRGYNEDDGSHKKILAIYNGHKPLARGYAVQPDDEWCATYASAMAILCGLTDIMPTECSCSKIIELHKKLGTWQERDDYVPDPADLVIYDWQDKKPETDNKNDPDHIGIVCSVTGNTIKVIEGNYSRSVKYRYIQVNGKNIRGFCTPDYASKASKAADPEKNSKTIDKLAQEVINGKHGTGEARKKSLGSLYKAVQDRVNEILGAGEKPEAKPEKPITVQPAQSFNKAFARRYKVNSAIGLKLRTGAGTSNHIIETMPNGSEVICYGYHTGNWLFVVSASGKQGFCHNGYLKRK